MNLAGITIKVGDRHKFIGKVGLAPAGSPGGLSGRPILYREVPWSDAYSTSTGSVSVDRNGWDVARDMGAEYMVLYCADVPGLVIVDGGELDHAHVVDLGERPQYRVHADDIEGVEGAGPIKMGWTNTTVDADDMIPEPEPAEPQARERIVPLFTMNPGDLG